MYTHALYVPNTAMERLVIKKDTIAVISLYNIHLVCLSILYTAGPLYRDRFIKGPASVIVTSLFIRQRERKYLSGSSHTFERMLVR